MANENPPVNGMYGGQYNQPAELAASTPAVSSITSSTAASSTAQKADPQEIGWYFVEQYYTTFSKTPEKIHLFYNKKSQLVTGMEAEKVLPCVGTRAISDKIKALDIQDCKVRVLNVDSQSSFQNIVVQVIGEMSNKSEPHHKFVQTFVLAEQPNGYFVLNDIFRYLSDEVDEIVEDEAIQPEVPAEEPATPVDSSVQPPEPEEEVVTEEAAKEVDEKLEDIRVEEAAPPTSVAVSATPVEEPSKTESVNEETPPPPSEPSDPTPTEEAQSTRPHTSTSEKAPTSDAPPAKKTWASMLGGKAAAVPALPINPAPSNQPKQQKAAPPTAPAAAAAAPKPTTQVPTQPPTEPAASSSPSSQSNGWQTQEKKSNRPQNKSAEPVTMAYIKNVTEKVDARILREVLESFGELKHFDVSRQRNCAFVEFLDPTGYAAAVSANPHTVGTEQIYVEERRLRSVAYNQNTPFGRGGGALGRGRGNMQQRTGSRESYPKDAGRGTYQPRGGPPKTGTITPKGRGTQAPAS